ncbi:MAG: DUF2878 family protein [Pseudomonadota bacterium]
MPVSPRHVRVLIVAAVTSLCAFGLEHLHRATGVWQLPPGAGFPSWILLVYLVSMLAFGLGLLRLEAALGSPLRSQRPSLGLEIPAALGLVMAPVLLWRHELGLLGLAATVCTLRLSWRSARGDWQVALGAAALDALVEGSLVGFGLYRYSEAAYAPLPLWLPLLWACLGPSVRRMFAWSDTATT